MEYTHIPDVSCFFAEKDQILHENPEAHFEYEMILVTEGSALVTINERSYEIGPKSLVFIGRMERHDFVVLKKPYRRYVVTMSGDLILSNIKDAELASIFLQRPKDFHHAVVLSDAAYARILPMIDRMADEYTRKPAFYVSRSASLVVATLIDLYRMHPECFPPCNQGSTASAVLYAQRYINDHFNEKITLEQIAEKTYLSRHTLSIAFSDIVGMTFKDYLILFRITEAKKLLITTNDSVETIAEKVGYINVNNFIRIFKERVKMTPLQFRHECSSVVI